LFRPDLVEVETVAGDVFIVVMYTLLVALIEMNGPSAVDSCVLMLDNSITSLYSSVSWERSIVFADKCNMNSAAEIYM
jgi:hypothetical protein